MNNSGFILNRLIVDQGLKKSKKIRKGKKKKRIRKNTRQIKKGITALQNQNLQDQSLIKY